MGIRGRKASKGGHVVSQHPLLKLKSDLPGPFYILILSLKKNVLKNTLPQKQFFQSTAVNSPYSPFKPCKALYPPWVYCCHVCQRGNSQVDF